MIPDCQSCEYIQEYRGKKVILTLNFWKELWYDISGRLANSTSVRMRFVRDVIFRFVCSVIVSSAAAGDDNINHFADSSTIMTTYVIIFLLLQIREEKPLAIWVLTSHACCIELPSRKIGNGRRAKPILGGWIWQLRGEGDNQTKQSRVRNPQWGWQMPDWLMEGRHDWQICTVPSEWLNFERWTFD